MMRVMDTFPRDCGVVHRSRLMNLILRWPKCSALTLLSLSRRLAGRSSAPEKRDTKATYLAVKPPSTSNTVPYREAGFVRRKIEHRGGDLLRPSQAARRESLIISYRRRCCLTCQPLPSR
jgi:hypothetical protein